ncbi:TetR/AcrR family transcriptional regulator [Allosphingosinicella indica]|uniref:Transcriptional regulator, TetR family n=1 Tax=Allosphingosinicella indica TaxID=941907 RepID=A0A1X7FYR4_9SPHN|nr:TetR/AcrR family transcriptional regulator [Allosphingosinicella indica]SMF61134.1 transcriptional regulator, TetR family [Allosphingosinicella indica]
MSDPAPAGTTAAIRAKPGRPPSPERRQAMVAAAVAILSEAGVDAMTTREVAARAGASERTLFKHFGSKEGLVRAVIDHAVIGLLDRSVFPRVLEPEPLTRASFAEWHISFLSNRLEQGKARPENYLILFRELFRDAHFRSLFKQRWRAAVFEPMAAQFAAMIEAGHLSGKISATTLAGLFFSTNLGYLLARFVLATDEPWADESDCKALVAAFAHLLE